MNGDGDPRIVPKGWSMCLRFLTTDLSGISLAATLLLLAALTVGPPAVRAQYNEPEDYEASSDRFLSLGWTWRDFRPTASNPPENPYRISYDIVMPMVGFHQGTLDVQFGYGAYTLEGERQSTIFFGMTVGTELFLKGDRRNALVAPVMFVADYTKAQALGNEADNFNFGSFGIGVGLKYRSVGESRDLWVSAVGAAQYSFSAFRFVYGFSATAFCEGTLLLKKVPLVHGIAIGYRFRYQHWSMSEHVFNYQALAHGPFLGVIL